VESLREELVHRLEPPDDGVRFDLHAQFPEIIDLRFHDRLRQTELRDPVNEDAARLVQRLEDRDVIAEFDQIAAIVSPEGPAPTTATLFPFGFAGEGIAILPDCRSVSAANRSRRPTATVRPSSRGCRPSRTGPPAADAAADSGEGVRLLEFQRCLDELPCGDQCDESRDIDIDGAAGDAAGLLALNAALRLDDRGLLG